MELMYPIIVVICIIISIIIYFLKINNNEKYTEGKKIANTKYIKETKYYKSKIKTFKIISIFIKVMNIIIICVCGILIARPITEEFQDEDKYNRDIILSIDLSGSQNEVNLELIKKFKEIIPNISGDRIGIVIFNTAPVVYCPLTTDYDYITECLQTIEKQLKKVIDNNGIIPFDLNDQTAQNLFCGGILDGNETKGSSLIGDGLAGTIYSFSGVKENNERTRIIIFATDNAVAGTETVSLEDACSLCKKYKINIYAYCPPREMNIYVTEEGKNNYKNAIEKNANGKFYTGDISKMASSIMKEIKETKPSIIKTNGKKYIVDHPEIFIILMTINILILFILEKIIKI